MRDFSEARDELSPDELWVVEHTPVFTLGQAGKREHLLESTEVPVVQSDRGGQIIASGTPEDIAAAKGSHTGAFLKRLLGTAKPARKMAKGASKRGAGTRKKTPRKKRSSG